MQQVYILTDKVAKIECIMESNAKEFQNLINVIQQLQTKIKVLEQTIKECEDATYKLTTKTETGDVTVTK
jgi:chaperonin cofactor prefoldin